MKAKRQCVYHTNWVIFRIKRLYLLDIIIFLISILFFRQIVFKKRVICSLICWVPFLLIFCGSFYDKSDRCLSYPDVNPVVGPLADEGGGAGCLNPYGCNYNSIVYNAPTGCCHCALNNGYVWGYGNMPQPRVLRRTPVALMLAKWCALCIQF